LIHSISALSSEYWSKQKGSLMMPFVRIKGMKGKLYIPEGREGCCKKHPCQDCFACEQCSDDRCRLCRKSRSMPGQPKKD
jgi:hypothetical protein